MLEHRGVGESTRLGCPAQESVRSVGGTSIVAEEWKPCMDAVDAEWGEDIKGFTVTNAAHDLGRLIDATRSETQSVAVYGVSYGTYWAHRYLQLYPVQADAIILDSICSPGQCSLPLGFSRDHNRIGQELMQLCGQDSFCQETSR